MHDPFGGWMSGFKSFPGGLREYRHGTGHTRPGFGDDGQPSPDRSQGALAGPFSTPRCYTHEMI